MWASVPECPPTVLVLGDEYATVTRARCHALLPTEPLVRGDDHEPAPLVEHLTSAELSDEFGSCEGMPVHAMA